MLTNTRLFSSNAAAYNSPGQGPGDALVLHPALKGRHNRCIAPSGLGSFWNRKPRALPFGPRALPWAVVSCPVGAEEKSHTAKRAVLEKMVNANMEGMGYGG